MLSPRQALRLQLPRSQLEPQRRSRRLEAVQTPLSHQLPPRPPTLQSTAPTAATSWPWDH